MTCHEVSRLIDPYLDNELETGELEGVAAHLQTCRRCSRSLEDRESLSQIVRRAPYHAAPERLRVTVAQAARRRRFWPGGLTMLAAAASIAIVAGIGTLRIARTASAPAAERSIVDEAVASHMRSLMADHLFDVESTDQHTVKPWFLGRLDFAPPVDDFAAEGFPLVGGRLDYIGGRAVASLVYKRRQHTINVFVWPSGPAPSLEARTIRGFQALGWTVRGFTFCAVSDLNAAELAELARLSRQRQ